jgi:rhodanese-related sulfurtransferase
MSSASSAQRRRPGLVVVTTLCAALVTLACTSADPAATAKVVPPAMKSITARDLWGLLAKDDKLVVVDVRDKTDYDAGHVPGAISAPLKELAARYKELDAGKKVILYCHAGAKSALAATELARLGFDEVYSLAGGMKAWPYVLQRANAAGVL